MFLLHGAASFGPALLDIGLGSTADRLHMPGVPDLGVEWPPCLFRLSFLSFCAGPVLMCHRFAGWGMVGMIVTIRGAFLGPYLVVWWSMSAQVCLPERFRASSSLEAPLVSARERPNLLLVSP
jgi:hypothetical protein